MRRFEMRLWPRHSTINLHFGLLLLGVAIATGSGCRSDSTDKEKKSQDGPKARPVRVLVVEDAAFAEVLERQWSARTDSDLELEQMTLAEFSTVVGTLRQLPADVIIYPSGCLGTLAHRKLIETPSSAVLQDAVYDAADVFSVQRNAAVCWGSEPYAFSFGSPQLVLFYRADLFKALGLVPPKTWSEYETLLEQLERSELGDLAPAESQAWSPTCEPLADGWASRTLLARAASYASHPSQFSVLFDYRTMKPLIDGPPFVRALNELLAASPLGPADADQVTPASARARIFAGETAIAFSWPSHATGGALPVDLADGVKIGFAELPGSKEAFDFGEQTWSTRAKGATATVPLIGIAGKLGSVAMNARRPREAAEVLALLAGKEWSELLSPTSGTTTLFRQSHIRKPQLWTDQALPLESATQYAEVVAATQTRPIQVASIRIPGWQRYLAALDHAVHVARAKEKSAEEALGEAAQSWSEITNELGLESQRKAYTHSLGLDR